MRREVVIKILDKNAEERKINYEKHPLQTLFLEVTHRCNAKCEHCGSNCGLDNITEEISTELLKKTLKEISEAYDPSEILLAVTGGEPVLRKDLFEIMEYAVSLGFYWGMTSNGILYTDKMIEQMKKAKLETISISIDGLEKTHDSFRGVPGAFKKSINNIKKLLDAGFLSRVQVSTAVNKKNINEIPELFELFNNMGLKEWRIMSVDPIGRAKENKNILLDKEDYKYMLDAINILRHKSSMNVTYGCANYLGIDYEMALRDWPFRCVAGLNVASILYNGDIFVCPNVERRPELIQGNIKIDNFVDVWENKFKIYRNEDRCSCEKCKKCKSWKYCCGGSLHMWDFDKNEPNFCMKDICEEDFL